MLQRVSSLIILVSMHVILEGVVGMKHVHFQIHVPEIIKHHIHTKTIFLHIHPKEPPKEPPKKEPPKKKPNHYEQSNYEDWSSYSSYNNVGNHEEMGENGEIFKAGHEKEKCIKGNNYQKDNYNSYFPTSYGNANHESSYKELSQPNDNYNYNPNYNHNNPNANYNANPNYNYNPNPNYNYNPNPHYNPNYPSNGNSQYNDGQDMIGYMYPPQYAIHEDVNDIPNNEIEQLDVYENGYKRGLESEDGHLITKNLKDFYDDKYEEAEEFAEQEEQDEKDEHKGNYDKEIGHRDRSSNVNGQRRRFFLGK